MAHLPAQSRPPSDRESHLPALSGRIPRPNFDPRELINPVTRLVVSPSRTWESIRTDKTTFREIYFRYVFILALIPPVCGFIGGVTSGTLSAESAGVMAVLAYLLSLVLVVIAAGIAEHSAAMFGPKLDLDIAGKLVVYSLMPYFLCGVFLLHPAFAPFALLGSYSFLLFFRGVAILTPIHPNERIAYSVVNVVPWVFLADYFLHGILFPRL